MDRLMQLREQNTQGTCIHLSNLLLLLPYKCILPASLVYLGHNSSEETKPACRIAEQGISQCLYLFTDTLPVVKMFKMLCCVLTSLCCHTEGGTAIPDVVRKGFI